MLEAPRLSGASLCALGHGTLVVHGGRSSLSGETLSDTYLARVAGRRVVWDRLTSVGPRARCYHAAAAIADTGNFKGSDMLVFGGAGGQDLLLNDLCRFRLSRSGAAALVGEWQVLTSGHGGLISSDGDSSRRSKELLRSSPSVPEPRSSHVFVAWPRKQQAVLHGGLGQCGVLADSWICSSNGNWRRLPTCGGMVARAHHCGGICRDLLFVYWGQDEGYLTVGTVYSLDLLSAIWSEVLCSGPAPRIDAAAAVVEDVGTFILGGVNCQFEFDVNGTWMMRAQDDCMTHAEQIPYDENKGPKPHACGSVCAHGLRLYSFGGFDGQFDIGEVYTMSLKPCCFTD